MRRLQTVGPPREEGVELRRASGVESRASKRPGAVQYRSRFVPAPKPPLALGAPIRATLASTVRPGSSTGGSTSGHLETVGAAASAGSGACACYLSVSRRREARFGVASAALDGKVVGFFHWQAALLSGSPHSRVVLRASREGHRLDVRIAGRHQSSLRAGYQPGSAASGSSWGGSAGGKLARRARLSSRAHLSRSCGQGGRDGVEVAAQS